MKKIEYNRGRISPAKEIAAVAVMCALLIGGQLALSFVSGVEVVTVLLLSFSFTYGRRAGALTAISFSLLRCFIAGFVPNVIVLYLIYYTVFALTFGALGSVKREVFENFPVWAAVIVNFVIALLAIGCGLCAATNFLKISRLSVVMVKTLLWIIFGLSCAMLVVFNTVFVMQKRGKLKSKSTLIVVVVTSAAAIFTVCFTLLDDFITPLFMGWGLFSESAAAYFFASFLALAPQTVCTIVSVSTLFLPLTAIFGKTISK